MQHNSRSQGLRFGQNRAKRDVRISVCRLDLKSLGGAQIRFLEPAFGTQSNRHTLYVLFVSLANLGRREQMLLMFLAKLGRREQTTPI